MMGELLSIRIPIDPVPFAIGGLEVSWHGILAALGVVVGVMVAARFARRVGFTEDQIYNTAVALVVGGIVGARALYVLEHLDQFRDDPADIFAINAGGISIYGALIGGTLESTNFRNRFNCSVVAIRKHGRVLHERLGSVSLELGDALLLHGTPYALEQLKREPAFIVTEQAPLATFRREKIPIALSIILAVVGVAGMGVPILVTAMVGSVLTVLTGCLKVNEIHESIRWDVIFLLAGVLPLGLALERTGAAQWVANLAVQLAGSVSPLAMLMIFYVAGALLTEFISNNATVVVLAPIAGATATALGLRPSAFILAIMFAASTSFMTPIGYQTNTMVYGPGGYKFLDFFRVGALLNLLLALTTPVFIWLFWGL